MVLSFVQICRKLEALYFSMKVSISSVPHLLLHIFSLNLRPHTFQAWTVNDVIRVDISLQ
jgi:hypothetical protein